MGLEGDTQVRLDSKWTSSKSGEITTDKIQVGELLRHRQGSSIPVLAVDADTQPIPAVGERQTLPAPLGEVAEFRVALPGAVIASRYRIVELLGEGGMGNVFKVRHAQLDKHFALKLLHPRAARDADLRKSFFREAKYASSLEHPNLVSVLDFGEDREYGPYMVMELATGKLLSTLVSERKKLSVKRATDIVLQIAEALAYVHNQDIIHCDIKPQNIMLSQTSGDSRRKYRVKVIDFGLAAGTFSANRSRLFGTPEYLPPELATSGIPQPASDVYSLGVLLFELLTGKLPFRGTVRELIDSHQHQVAPTLAAISGENFDPALEGLVAKALVKEPYLRHGNMKAFLYELRTVMDMQGFARPTTARHSKAIKTTETVIDRRSAAIKVTFDSLHLPLATINREGEILAANSAFARFVLGIRVHLEGSRIHDTSLARAWHSLEDDIRAAVGGDEIGRQVSVVTADGEQVSLQMWLEPTIVPGLLALSLHPESMGSALRK